MFILHCCDSKDTYITHDLGHCFIDISRPVRWITVGTATSFVKIVP